MSLAPNSSHIVHGKNWTGTGTKSTLQTCLDAIKSLGAGAHHFELREQLGVKKGVPAEVHINAAAGTVLKGSLNKTENRWGHSLSSFCRDDRISRVLGLPTGSE